MTIPGPEQWTINECLDYIDYGIEEGENFDFLSSDELEMLKNDFDGDIESQEEDWLLN